MGKSGGEGKRKFMSCQSNPAPTFPNTHITIPFSKSSTTPPIEGRKGIYSFALPNSPFENKYLEIRNKNGRTKGKGREERVCGGRGGGELRRDEMR